MSPVEPVGSLAEEAAKLLAAVYARVGDGAASAADAAGSSADFDDEAAGPSWGEASCDAHHHADASSAECRWCPICHLVRMAKATNPDVREHLSQAALSLALAVKGLLEDPARTARRAAPLEKIDLTEE